FSAASERWARCEAAPLASAKQENPGLAGPNHPASTAADAIIVSIGRLREFRPEPFTSELIPEIKLRRVDGQTGKEVWLCTLDKKDQPALAGMDDRDWDHQLVLLWRGLTDSPSGEPNAWFVRPCPDLDGDGTGDLIWACRACTGTAPWLLAVSG